MRYPQISQISQNAKRNALQKAGGVSSASNRKVKAKCALVAPGHASSIFALLLFIFMGVLASANAGAAMGDRLGILNVSQRGVTFLGWGSSAVSIAPPSTSGFSILADAASALPDPNSWGASAWLIAGLVALFGVAGVVLAAINGALAIFDRIKGKKAEGVELAGQPIRVQGEIKYATHAEIGELKAAIQRIEIAGEDRREALEDKIDAQSKALEAKMDHQADVERTRTGNLHQRIDGLASKQGEMVGELKQVNENVRMLLTRGNKG